MANPPLFDVWQLVKPQHPSVHIHPSVYIQPAGQQEMELRLRFDRHSAPVETTDVHCRLQLLRTCSRSLGPKVQSDYLSQVVTDRFSRGCSKASIGPNASIRRVASVSARNRTRGGFHTLSTRCTSSLRVVVESLELRH